VVRWWWWGELGGAVVRRCSAAVDVAVGKFKLFSAWFSCLFLLYLFWYGIFLLFRRLSGKCLSWLFLCGGFSLTLYIWEREILRVQRAGGKVVIKNLF